MAALFNISSVALASTAGKEKNVNILIGKEQIELLLFICNCLNKKLRRVYRERLELTRDLIKVSGCMFNI